jgi:hypothetical protein
MVCKRTYNDTSEEQKFYTAQSEAFTILLDHAVTASKICTNRNNYACSSTASTYHGRLVSKNTELCRQEHASGRAFRNYRGGALKSDAPCYILPNRTSLDQDFFSLDTLLRAADGVSLDDCNSAVSSSDQSACQTYRDTGGTILLNIYWSDFHTYHGFVEPYYYYSPHFLAGSSFKQNIPYYQSYRATRTLLNAHGIRVAVLLGGDYHEFNVVTFMVTLTTALGLLAVATTIVDALMLYILPEKRRYWEVKYEEEGGDDGTLARDDAEGGRDTLPRESIVGAAEGEGQELREPLLPTDELHTT